MNKMIVVAIFFLSFHGLSQNTFLERDGQDECRCGELEAIKNAEEGKYIIYRSGLETPDADQDFERFYVSYMKRNFGITILNDSHGVTRKDWCYFVQMSTILQERFGDHILDVGRERAKVAYRIICPEY